MTVFHICVLFFPFTVATPCSPPTSRHVIKFPRKTDLKEMGQCPMLLVSRGNRHKGNNGTYMLLQYNQNKNVSFNFTIYAVDFEASVSIS